MPDAFRPASRIFNRFLRLTLGNWLLLRFRPRIDAAVLENMAPPFLLVANHSCNWDAFLMGVPVQAPVHYVASDEYFRTPFLRFLFTLIGGIPKTKNISDSSTIRAMLAVRKHGGIIGLYPEGNRNWDGVTGPLFPATAKLIKKFRIPVLTVVSTGNMLIQPRWSRYARSGPLFIDFRLLFTEADCESLSEQEIADRLEQALAHDDHPDAEARTAVAGLPFRYRGKRLAERLERFLFQCAGCGSMDTLSSVGDRLMCSRCGMHVRYGEDGRLSGFPEDRPAFALTRDWDRWQCANLSTAIQAGLPSVPILENDGAMLQFGGKYGKLQAAGTGSLSLYPDRLVFAPSGDRSSDGFAFPLLSVSGLNIQYSDRCEFYHNDALYRFSFPGTNLSIWKWHQAILFASEALRKATARSGSTCT